METAVMPGEGSTLLVEQQEHYTPPLQHNDATNSLIRTSMEDSPEDYGPLKKKHKYRDEQRDKERSGSISFNANTAAPTTDDTSITLDSSTQSDSAALDAPAVIAQLGDAAPSGLAVVEQDHHQQEQERDRDQPIVIELQQQDQTNEEHQQQQQQQPDKSSRDLANSPGGSISSEKTRKHNFYVPSREVAFLLDSVSADASSSSHDIPAYPASVPHTTSTSNNTDHNDLNTISNTANGVGSDATGNNGAPSSLDPAQINANALLATGMSITGRQAAKIAAMEAKEKIRLAKEKELEENRAKKKAELERKKLEAARKKAEKEANAPANIGIEGSAVDYQGARRNSSVSNTSAQYGVPHPSTIPANAAVPSKATSAARKRAPASRKGASKATPTIKQDSPDVASPNANLEHGLPSPDIKVGSPSLSTSHVISQDDTSHPSVDHQQATSVTSASNDLSLPPMPEPEIDPLTGFIPYASEGARAAALAKAAKQKANGGGAGSPPSSIPIPLPNVKNGGGRSNGRKGSTGAGNGSPLAMQQLLSAAGATPPSGSTAGTSTQNTGGGKKGRSSTSAGSGNNGRTKAQALAAAAAASSSSANYSGRASPTNALEHAAAAIDAVLDAGAMARAQAQAEEEEVDDRLYCICQQLYDPERLMIACDRCDNWYHADCINIDETQINLIDLFICPICEKDSDLHTVSKSRCAREDCTEAALKLSKYCSDRCGILVATSKLEQDQSSLPGQEYKNSTSLNLLWDAVSSVKKLETVIRSVEDDLTAENPADGNALELEDTTMTPNAAQNGGTATPNTFSLQARANEEQQRLDKLQMNLADYVTRREALENSLALATARLTYFNYAKGRWKLSWIDKALQKPSTTNNKKASAKAKSSKAGEEADKVAVPPDALCGFDVRLVWDDRDWQEWLDSDEGRKIMDIAEEFSNAGPNADPAQYIKIDQGEVNGDGDDNDEEGLVCTLTKKKCDRHAAWQKLRQADFDVDKTTLERQLELLTDSERRIRRRVEDIQDFLRRANGKLSAMSSNAATPIPNGDGIADVEGEEDIKEEQDAEMET